jgi:hypothetical protein
VRGLGDALMACSRASQPGRGGSHRPRGGLERLGLDGVADLAAVPALGDQPRLEQDGELLGDGLPGERKLLRQSGRDGLAVDQEHAEQTAAARSATAAQSCSSPASVTGLGPRAAAQVVPQVGEVGHPAAGVLAGEGLLLLLRPAHAFRIT